MIKFIISMCYFLFQFPNIFQNHVMTLIVFWDQLFCYQLRFIFSLLPCNCFQSVQTFTSFNSIIQQNIIQQMNQNPLKMSDNQLKQYIDQVFIKYDYERNGTLNTLQMANYLTQLFEVLGYGQVQVSPEEALQAIQMMDRNNDNKITKMELFLTFKELSNTQVTDFGGVKIFFMGQGGFNTDNSSPLKQNTNQNNWGPQTNSNNQLGQNHQNNTWDYNINNNSFGSIPQKPYQSPSHNWNQYQNQNQNQNNNYNNRPPLPNKTPEQINKQNYNPQQNMWGPQTPQPPTWGQQQARGSGANIQHQLYQQQVRGSGANIQNTGQGQMWAQQARGSGANIQQQLYQQQARGSGTNMWGQYARGSGCQLGWGYEPSYQTIPMSNNLIWGNGSNQQLIWGVPGQRPGTPPSAGYSGGHQIPVYYDPYYGGYMKVGKGNQQQDNIVKSK